MGMYLALATLSDANIQRVLEDPPLVCQVIAPDDPEMYETARAGQKHPTLLSRLFGRGSRTRNDHPLKLSTGEGIDAYIDKAWHGIHYLLTGTAWEGTHPYNFLVSGGQEVGDLEIGYGPARVLTAIETQEVHGALQSLDDEALRARFDPTDMLAKEIYPEIWARNPEEDDTLEYLMEHVQVIRDFLRQASETGMGLVVTIG